MKTRFSMIISLILLGCDPSGSVPAQDPVSPEFDGSGEFAHETHLTPIDGEYVLRAEPTEYFCGEPKNLPVFYTTADVVRQSNDTDGNTDSSRFDLFAVSYDILAFTHWGLSRDEYGWFTSDTESSFWFFDTLLYLRRYVGGSVDSSSIAFSQYNDLGAYDDGDWVSGCRMAADYYGQRRYVPWRLKTEPVQTIDRRWSVEKTVLEKVWDEDSASARAMDNAPDGAMFRNGLIDTSETTYAHGIVRMVADYDPVLLNSHVASQHDGEKQRTLSPVMTSGDFAGGEYVSRRNIVVDTLVQERDGSFFDIRGTKFGFNQVIRAADGSVDVWIYNSAGHEITLSGKVTDTELDLEFTWRWFDYRTGDTLLWLRERYEGVPRFEPHMSSVRARGEYNSRFELIEDSCYLPPYARRRITDVLPNGPGKARVGLTAYYSEPVIDLPEDGGVFNYTFERRWLYRYRYSIDGSVDGDSLNATMKIDVYHIYGDKAGKFNCSVTYAITDGFKRFQSYAPSEP